MALVCGRVCGLVHVLWGPGECLRMTACFYPLPPHLTTPAYAWGLRSKMSPNFLYIQSSLTTHQARRPPACHFGQHGKMLSAGLAGSPVGLHHQLSAHLFSVMLQFDRLFPGGCIAFAPGVSGPRQAGASRGCRIAHQHYPLLTTVEPRGEQGEPRRSRRVEQACAVWKGTRGPNTSSSN